MKFGLKIVLACLSLVPGSYGLYNFWTGISRFSPVAVRHPTLNSQFRFQSGIYFGLAMHIWWLIPRIHQETGLFRITVFVVFLGGLGRLLSYISIGPPGPVAIGAMILELTIPVLIIWQNAIREPKGRWNS
ncbi:MAG: DUF4345 domain-containing protein [Pseudomonadota bacterium]